MTVALDGKDVEGQIATQLEYLSEVARYLGVPDPVEEYFSPVVGRWSDMHAEADRWRVVGHVVEQVTETVNSPLGKLDAAWDGAAAESFVQYMQQIGLAGNDMSDAMIAMADVLDQTANAIREIVVELAGIMAETAETASEAMVLPVQGDVRVREYLDLMRRPTRELFEAVRQILEAFVQLCEGAEGPDAFRTVTMAHTFPAENWSAPATPGVPNKPIDTSTGSAGADIGATLGGGAGLGGGGGGAGLGGGGLDGAAAAASSGSSMAPGNYSVSGEQAPRGATPPAGAAAAAAAGAAKPGTGMPMMPMAPMAGGQGQGGDAEHKTRSRVVGNPQDIFGKPEKASTPVIGADD